MFAYELARYYKISGAPLSCVVIVWSDQGGLQRALFEADEIYLSALGRRWDVYVFHGQSFYCPITYNIPAGGSLILRRSLPQFAQCPKLDPAYTYIMAVQYSGLTVEFLVLQTAAPDPTPSCLLSIERIGWDDLDIMVAGQIGDYHVMSSSPF